MARAMERIVPAARKEGLVVKHLPDEVLVYDVERHKAHCLNRPAALIWTHCNGRMTVSDMVAALHEQLGVTVDQEVVWFALDQLSKAHLLESRVQPAGPNATVSRRELIKRIGSAAAIALPLVTSLLAPTAQAATSCNVTCFDDTPCVTAPSPCTTTCLLAANLCIG